MVTSEQAVCRPASPGHAALLALLGERVVGVASYETGSRPAVAEIAFAAADDMHGRGIATLLLEHLVSIGRARQVQSFAALILAENTAMLRVFADAGLNVQRTMAGTVTELTIPIPRAAALAEASPYLDAVAHRESLADVESLRPLLQPGSVAVVGASRQPGTVGRSILRNIVTAGFARRVYTVHPNARELDGVGCLPSVADLPEPPDLAVVAVPPVAVPAVAEECGQRGVKAVSSKMAKSSNTAIGSDDSSATSPLNSVPGHGRWADQAGRAVPRIVRQPPQVRDHVRRNLVDIHGVIRSTAPSLGDVVADHRP